MGDLLAAWEAAVGPEIARNAWPARYQRDGTLIVHTKDAIWGFELGHRAAEITRAPAGKAAPEVRPGAAARAGSPTPPGRPHRGRLRLPWSSRRRPPNGPPSIEDEELRKLVARAAAASLAKRSG